MSWMNEYEIDEALETLRRHAPEYAPYAQYLSDWRDTVNANSDGWAHWKGGSKPADRLSGLVKQALEGARGRGDMPDEADMRKALSPIKAAATKHRFQAPELADPPAAPGFR